MSTPPEREQVLPSAAWQDPAGQDNPAAALAQLGAEIAVGMKVGIRVQRRDTLYPRGGDA